MNINTAEFLVDLFMAVMFLLFCLAILCGVGWLIAQIALFFVL